jgi:hypothetical protein
MIINLFVVLDNMGGFMIAEVARLLQSDYRSLDYH